MAELDTTTVTETTEATETTETVDTTEQTKTEVAENAEITRLKAELAKAKAATDKATKEAADSKRALRAKQTAEEAAAEEAKAQQDALMQELETLRKERAVAATTAKVLPVVGNNDVAAKVAEYLYGAEDVESAIAEIQKAWTAKEKALRLEFGKIPAPGVGSSDGPTITETQFSSMSYTERAKLLRENPDEYRRLIGATKAQK